VLKLVAQFDAFASQLNFIVSTLGLLEIVWVSTFGILVSAQSLIKVSPRKSCVGLGQSRLYSKLVEYPAAIQVITDSAIEIPESLI